jgi:divalent metal cation (Fe/Co/Zn/Cd) transporter
VILSLSVIVMPLLARAKRQVAGQLGSRALAADAQQTSLCAYLSAIALIGVAMNALLGWWWADPAAALAMVPIIAREGIEGLHSDVASRIARSDTAQFAGRTDLVARGMNTCCRFSCRSTPA